MAIIQRATGDWVGEVVLNDLDADNLSAGFRILLIGLDYFCRGIDTEATRLVLTHSCEPVGRHRVELGVYAFNPRACRVYEKVGFLHECPKRQELLGDDALIDAHLMAILNEEWTQHCGYPELPGSAGATGIVPN